MSMSIWCCVYMTSVPFLLINYVLKLKRTSGPGVQNTVKGSETGDIAVYLPTDQANKDADYDFF